MPLSAIIAVIIFAAVCVGIVLWMRSRKSEPGKLPLYIAGFALIGYNKEQMTREQARLKAEDLHSIYIAVVEQLGKIYGKSSPCQINKLIFDNEFHKATEWSKVHARVLWVNPTRAKHRSHFAEEVHNRFRADVFGDAHIYKPIGTVDAAMRESAQEFCRQF